MEVGVCFEEQGIDTAQMSGELLTAIFSMIAQKESEAISENIRWSIRNRMENGTFTATSLPFGYTRDETGEIKVDLQRAGYEKDIFEAFLSGRNTKEIAEEMGISETTVKFHKSVAYRELNKSLGHLFLMITMLS